MTGWSHAELLRRALDRPQPSPEALERHREQVRQRLWRRAGLPVLPLAVSAVALVGLALAAWSLRGPQDLSVARADGEALVAGVLAWSDGPVQGTSRDRRVSLVLPRGHLELDVDPARDLDVTVSTAEARIQVEGTRFSVTRGPSGTTVAVERGRVAVTCTGRHAVQLLGAGGRVTCLRSVGLGLGLALGQRRVGAMARSLETTRDAQALPGGTPATRASLLALETELLLALDRRDEALAVAETTLAGEAGLHRDTWTRAVLAAPGCPQAEPFLSRLHDVGDAKASAHLARCLAPTAPDLAAEVLDEALARDPDPETRRRLERLSGAGAAARR